ncbi:MAG: SDR family NAD(P)-dependent oxidoreductase [Bacteroidales bacterium]|nr:SDR family NAD(P)-dependent oxidoreductase [Bacteroidales bacterium]
MKLRRLNANCKTALVTGGCSGMGLIFARKLAEAGLDVVIVSNREKELQEAADALSAQYPVKVTAHYQDLAAPDAAEQLYAWCQAEGICVDILINNAGMFFFKELEAADVARVGTMMNLHNLTVVKNSILFGDEMKHRGYGYILNMSSMAAKLPAPGITIYAATKAFLKSFGKSFSFEMRPYGVGVTTVCPAAIATPLYGLREDLLKFGVRIGVIRTPEWLVNRALRAMTRKRRVLRPGLMNVWLPAALALFPGKAETLLWEHFK